MVFSGFKMVLRGVLMFFEGVLLMFYQPGTFLRMSGYHPMDFFILTANTGSSPAKGFQNAAILAEANRSPSSILQK